MDETLSSISTRTDCSTFDGIRREPTPSPRYPSRYCERNGR